MNRGALRHLLPLLFTAAVLIGCRHQEALTIGSKRFTESYILGEILRQTADRAGEAKAAHRQGLGGTGIVFEALKTGSIDLYPEYTGTIDSDLLKNKNKQPSDLAALNRQLAPMRLAVGVPLGFRDNYALAMRADRSDRLGIRAISDLARHPEVKLGFSPEFLQRPDGWRGLKTAYNLPFATPRGLEHGLAYEAIGAGQIDVMDIYTTDAKLARYRLRELEDDRNFFPRYDAVLLYRADLPQRLPQTWDALQKLKGKITEKTMIDMNAAAELQHQPFSEIAASFLTGAFKP